MNRVDLRVTERILWLASKPKRIKIAVGGRGSQKTTGVSDLMIRFADGGERICCAREFQNSIDDSVHENLKDEIARLGVKGFNVLSNEIRTVTQGQIFYKGLARNITSLKSLAGVKRLWIEEGESVSEKSLRVLTPSIRSSAASNQTDEDPPEIWITMNRGSSNDAIAKKYLQRADKELKRTGYYEDDLMMAVELNWKHNPWFPPELEQERLDDKENLSVAEYQHIWEGEYNDTVDNAIIPADWFDACIDAHLKLGIEPRGIEVVIHDPSDTGSDGKGLAYRHGIVIKNAMERSVGLVNDGAEWAIEHTLDIKPDLFMWDGDGMGLALRKQFNDDLATKRIQVEMFRGSSGVDHPDEIYEDSGSRGGKPNKQVFKNKRAQYWWYLRDRMHRTYQAVVKGKYFDPDTLISFSSEMNTDGVNNLDALRSEICRIPLKPSPTGLIQIMSKPDMKKIGIPSPNMGDCVMMAFANPSLAVNRKPKARPLTQVSAAGWT